MIHKTEQYTRTYLNVSEQFFINDGFYRLSEVVDHVVHPDISETCSESLVL